MMKLKRYSKIIFNVLALILTILLLKFITYGLHLGISQDQTILVNQIQNFGYRGPIIFILFQAIQVVFPIIPGGASCLAGVLAFGPHLGFIYNYLGLTIGSLISFSLSKKYGLIIIRFLFSQETLAKYLPYLEKKQFYQLFFLGILIPGAPDDLLCYIAGLSSMNYKTFLLFILLGKPLTLSFYSIFTQFLL